MAAYKSILLFFIANIINLLDLSSILLVFVLLAENKKQLQREIFSFKFGTSTFDLLILSILRFSVILGAIIGVAGNHVEAVVRMVRLRKLTLYYGCFQAIYIVAKILVYSEDNDHMGKRFWIMTGITLVSSVTFHGNWRILASNRHPCRVSQLNINDDFIDNCLQSNSNNEAETDNCNKKSKMDVQSDERKMNAADKKEADKLTSNYIILKLLKMAKKDTWLLIIAFIALFTCSVSQAIMPYYTGLVVNYIVIEKSVDKYKEALLYMALITLLAGFAAGVRAGLFTYILGRYTLRLQYTLFSRLMQMEIGFFDTRKTGELTSRLTTDCTKVGDGIGLRLNIFVRSIVEIIGILFFMVKLSWKLSTVTLVAVPIIAILSDFFGTQYKEVSEKVQNSLAQANASAEEAVSCIRTVRSFAAETNEAGRYSKLLDSTRAFIKKEGVIAAGYRWSNEMTNCVMTILILYYGGHLVMHGDLSGGHLVSFILYSFELTYAIQSIGNVYTGLMEVVGASKKIFFYIDRKPDVNNNGTLIPNSGIEGHVKFENVSFTYPSREDTPVLKNLSFTAEKGEVVALVGPSGGGKSSVINLLQHFYEPQSGRVLIDGVDVKEYNHKYLHERMSLVQQEPVLFARTVFDNISYGLQIKTCEDEVADAAKLANAHGFIAEMPAEYQTETGEKGVQLSGGQKQRVAIARALIRNPTILLLDEATSALDSESEHLVQQAINRNLSGRTVIVIAHRLSTIERADKILVIENGEIVEVGKHQELIDYQGVYAELVKKQLLGYSDEAVKPYDQISVKEVRKKSVDRVSCSSLMSVKSDASIQI